MKKINLRSIFILMLAITIGVIIIFLWKYQGWRLISISYLRRFTYRIKVLGLLGIILYIIVFALATMVCMPSLPFVILGGITYGTVTGILYATIADLLGATLAFIAARYLIKDRVEKRLRKYKAFHEINDGVRKDGWRVLVLTRMVPVIPHWLQNYAYGITSISLKTYVLVSLICIIPGTAVWIFAVNTVGKGEGDAKKTMFYLGIAAVLMVLVSYLPKWIYKKKKINRG